jgi:protein-disulfide isomerase
MLLMRHPRDVRIVFRHFPLRIHRLAIQAAKAAECASDQGRFQSMSDALYAHQDSVGIVSARGDGPERDFRVA